MEKQLEENVSGLREQIEFARPYLDSGQLGSFRALATGLAGTLLGRLDTWRSSTARDGEPLIDEKPYNEWVYWDSMGYRDLPFDIVITNQIIASAEYTAQTIHTALRGGLTVGSASYAKSSRYGTYVFFSTFPLAGTGPNLRELGDGDAYDGVEAARLAGAYLAHEIGHQLFHFGHPYGNPACVMHPVSLLKFREWYERLNPTKCRVGSEPAMTPGAINIYFYTLVSG